MVEALLRCWLRCDRDIWGDTVNTASRMEYPKGGKKMSGECGSSRAFWTECVMWWRMLVTGAIRISPFTYELIKDSHNCEFSGQLEVSSFASRGVLG